jgi:arsenite/tail-anchored protein-transporting ATPase
MARVPDISFFIGKGGVGKTTVSAAYALRQARRHPSRRILVLSTDPAHSTADVLQVRAEQPVSTRLKLPFRGRVELWQLDAQQQFRQFIDQYREAILALVEQGTIFSRAEIEPLLDSTVPGMAEVSALLALHDLLDSAEYDEIVVDTAPIGHTLRLFELPEHFRRFFHFLDVAGSRDRVLAEHFGGTRAPSHPVLAEWQRIVDGIQSALTGGDSRLVLVTTPETFALNESARIAASLAESTPELPITAIVLNRAVTGKTKCAICGERRHATAEAEKFLAREFPKVPVQVGPDPGGPILGADLLAKFGDAVFGGKKSVAASPAPHAPGMRFLRAHWPGIETPLAFTLGKGGVGKTTTSAALALAQRHRRAARPIMVCSTDPAPSLDDVFATDVGDKPVAVLGDRKLRAMELDSVAEFRRWSDEMRYKVDRAMQAEVRGIHLDLAFDHEILIALLDIVPPGVDELFAIFRILDLVAAGRERVLIDMAPTGHALELLRMPDRIAQWARLLLKSLAPHRTLPLAQDLAVEIAGIGQRVRELAKQIRDPERAAVWPVMLAEPLPDRETRRLLAELDELGVQPQALFVNRVIMQEDGRGCERCARLRAWQSATLARWRNERRPVYVVRNFPHEIAGRKRLEAFIRELWQLGPAEKSAKRSRKRNRRSARRRRS